MTTRRNNMFHDRGEMLMIDWISKIVESVGSLDDLKVQLKSLKEMKAPWMTECLPGFITSTFEGKSLITNHYFVTVKNNKYILLNHPDHNKINTIYLWSESTSTQCIVDIYGDDSVIEFIDNDLNFQDSITSLINMADDYEIINRLKTVAITDLYTDIYN